MKFQCESKILKDVLGLVCSIPGYSDHTILLTALKKGELRIEGAASGSYIKIEIAAKVMKAGSINVDADYITSLHLKEHSLFQLNGANLTVSSGKYNYKLHASQSTKVAKQRPSGTIDCPISLSRDVLTAALARTAVVPSIPNPGHGVRLQVHDSKFKVFCNDSFRGTMYRRDLPGDQKGLDVMVKHPVLSAVVGRIPDQNILLGESKGVLKLMSGSVEFYHPTLQTQPEPVEAVFDSLEYKDCEGVVPLNVDDFINDVRAASSIVSSLSYETKLTMSFEEDALHISASSPHGDASAEHTLGSKVEKPFELKMSNKYLQEMLTLLNESEFTLNIWSDRVTLESNDGVYKSIMPTITDQEK